MDEALVVRAQGGDAQAFAALAASTIDRLYAIAYRILRETELARDATQDALLEAWRDLPSLRDPARWEAWTYRLVVHACYNQRRSDRRLSAAIQFFRVDRSSVPDTALSVADRDELERGFRRLPAEQRAVIVLHHYQGLPLTEVADVLGIPAGTARSRLHYATRRLRAALTADATLPATGEERTV
ncbi:MAG TPA: RNA polymerase sigma factor [Candidatus Limnocylindria bacterium]|jgi:RNA polymerase sigma-70 factor (ECF subfamily)|nr:RNA polymerase sigma factor [Candidatus Limnocylindria bacterium]